MRAKVIGERVGKGWLQEGDENRHEEGHRRRRRYLAHAICNVTSNRSGHLDSADNLCAPRTECPRAIPAPVAPTPYRSLRPPTSVSHAVPAPIGFHSLRRHSCALMITRSSDWRPRNPLTTPRRHGWSRPPHHGRDGTRPMRIVPAKRFAVFELHARAYMDNRDIMIVIIRAGISMHFAFVFQSLLCSNCQKCVKCTF